MFRTWTVGSETRVYADFHYPYGIGVHKEIERVVKLLFALGISFEIFGFSISFDDVSYADFRQKFAEADESKREGFSSADEAFVAAAACSGFPEREVKLLREIIST